ncbi:hypothetical protein TPHA_0E01320 [Tetrapisispora phaffii CBS 4417]|uniref:Protein CFT1 n=1 Tax=Tetrapisispora phaffii (strain ATCC 24235 / CBS 4417 / NBRC 1672 / NRRL Y-8282 / UCD 70-5) TaxID=1071381 RepID=G8BTJ9_TETPH|nr:hypothetical protein TPHA_0E01320 [Tetrapisispora phaffii CBS 4417]CCE63227.1 hypothetical protein TPHA_0E01320 [Tetrapisispora phaffii CBS 4417]
MNIYDDVLDATVVSSSLVGHFTSEDYKELITVRTNILSIFQVDKSTNKLHLNYEFKLNGRVSDIALIKQVDSKLDYLIILTATAKLSLVNFNVFTNSLETISLHYYEDKFRQNSILKLAKESKLRIDQAKNCVLLFNNDNIAILPISSTTDEFEDEDLGQESSAKTVKRGNMSIKFPSQSQKKNKITNSSIILKSTELNSKIQNIIDIQFLSNFSKPTLSVLYQPKLAWIGNSNLVTLPTQYMILTLNILERENIKSQENGENSLNQDLIETTIIGQVSELPYELHTIIPLNNGSTLVGSNEIIYIDHTGVLQSLIIINQFQDKETLKKGRVIDKSKQNIILNKPIKFINAGSRVESNNVDDKNNVLIFDENNNIYLVNITLEGRLLINFDINKLPIVNDVLRENSNPLCISCLRSDIKKKFTDLYIGYQSGNALLLRLNNLDSAIDSKKEKVETKINTLIYAEDDEDDLYSHEKESTDDVKNTLKKIETIQPFDIELLSSYKNIGQLSSIVVGKTSSVEKTVKGLPNPNSDEYSIVATSGHGTGSHLTVVQPSVKPSIELALKFISVTQIWNLKFKSHDKYLVTTDSKNNKSAIYQSSRGFELYKEGRFRRDATTVYVSMFGEDKRIVQVTTNHLYLYDTNFRRLTTMNFEFEVVNVSVLDPYILITLSRGDIKLYELEENRKRKLFRVELPEILPEMVLTSGVILKSNMCNEFLTDSKNSDKEELLFTFVTADNQIIFFPRNHNDRIFQLNGVDQLDETLFISTYQLPLEVIPDPQIKQVMINKLGKANKEEYLTILTFGGEIYQYQKSIRRHSRFHRNVTRNNLSITGAPDNAYAKGVSSIERIMHYIPNYNGYSSIFITGNDPYILLKEDDSVPRIFKFANIPLVSMCPWGKTSVMCVDDIKNARVYTLEVNNMYYGNKLPLLKVTLSDTIEDYMTLTKITYHEGSNMYIVAYAKDIEYTAIGEDGERLVGSNEELPHSMSTQSGILLINPKTWNVIDRKDYEANTIINDIRTMIIQLNSKTNFKKELIVVGISNVGTEDLPPTGSFYIYNTNEVVPDPSKPDTNYRFKDVFHEQVKGTINNVCEISGRFMVNQSQKLLVRDIQEDESVVPVAFHDVPVFVADIKSFGNLFIVGDSMQGFQFVGFDAEPYRMIMLGRSVSKFKTMALDFVVRNGEIYFVVSDTDDILHILKYSPDEPNSLSGQRLAHYSSFNIHSTNTSMHLLPANDEFIENKGNGSSIFQTIGANLDGSIFKILPLSEDSFRRLYVIQQQIIDTEVHAAGLNPRMERLSNEYYQLTNVTRPLLDFNLIRRYSNLSIKKRKSIAQKAGRNAHFEAWRDIINVEFSLRSLTTKK